MNINEAIDALEAAEFSETGQTAQSATPETATPEAAAEEAPAPITAEAVAGDKADTPAPADSTLLRDRLQALTSSVAPPVDNRDAELEQLRAAVQQLSLNKVADPISFLQQQTGLTPEQLIAQQQAPDSLAQRAIAEAQSLREEQTALRAELAEKEQEREYEALKAGMKAFVQSGGDEYVVTNNSNNQDLALELMHSSAQAGEPLSETQAAAQVESKLQSFINDNAAALGWVRPEANSQALGNSETQPSVTINPQTAATTPGKSWDEMSFDEREQEALKLLS